MKNVYILLMLLVFPKLLFANACNEVEHNPKLFFYSSYGLLNYDFSRDVNYITRLGKQGHHHESFVAGGLAASTLEMSVNFKAMVQYRKPNDVCVAPSEVYVFVGFQDPTIYVANHLEEGSCEYYVTLRHEQAHMQINKKALEYFLPSFKEEIAKVVASVPPLNIGNINDVDQANEYINYQYYDKIRALVERFNEILAEEQQRLDNKSNYAYEHSLCK